MFMAELININVMIADRPYPLKIKPEEEEGIRRAAKMINDKVKEFQHQYAAKDKQDYLAMVTLMYAVETLNKESPQESAAVTDQLNKLEEAISQYLGS